MAYAQFESQTAGLLEAIRLCRSRQLTIPALMLLYATIDGMAWCARKNDDHDVTEEDFKAWVERYMFEANPPGHLSSVDLYAARCAMLHGQIAESRKSKHAAAREVHYHSAGGCGLVPVFGLNTPQPPVSVDIDFLCDAFEQAVAKFRAAIAADADLSTRVEASASKYLVAVRFGR
jgi:hypothetical protein